MTASPREGAVSGRRKKAILPELTPEELRLAKLNGPSRAVYDALGQGIAYKQRAEAADAEIQSLREQLQVVREERADLNTALVNAHKDMRELRAALAYDDLELFHASACCDTECEQCQREWYRLAKKYPNVKDFEKARAMVGKP